jgi:hypothetical protein
MRRQLSLHPAWLADRLPATSGEEHWHIEERWSSTDNPDGAAEVELLASTESVAWRVLIGRTGQLLSEDWSLDPARRRLDEVLLTRGDVHVLIRVWPCEKTGCVEVVR